MTLIIEIEDVKRQSLENIAALHNKKINEFVVEILDDYLHRKNTESEETNNLMSLSEISFNEWDNEEDAVYDKL